jgi:hypothetical protein
MIRNTHKSIIRINKEKPLNKSIPKNFSYIYFELSENEGYCHVIEDDFQPHRLKMHEVIGACIEIDQMKVKASSKISEIKSLKLKIKMSPFLEID